MSQGSVGRRTKVNAWYRCRKGRRDLTMAVPAHPVLPVSVGLLVSSGFKAGVANVSEVPEGDLRDRHVEVSPSHVTPLI